MQATCAQEKLPSQAWMVSEHTGEGAILSYLPCTVSFYECVHPSQPLMETFIQINVSILKIHEHRCFSLKIRRALYAYPKFLCYLRRWHSKHVTSHFSLKWLAPAEKSSKRLKMETLSSSIQTHHTATHLSKILWWKIHQKQVLIHLNISRSGIKG